ncbi:MAG: serine/threonine-protein kinase, partial [Acidobacteriota bacterium]
MRFDALVLGKTVSHYRIDGRLGEGGMGIVYSATDIQLHRRVALKFAAEDQDPRARHRLAEEARAASSLNHPNIAQIYDFGETADGVPFFVMELVEGRGLNDVIRSGPMKPDMVVHIAEEVCSALGEAHGKGIVHRDIKPANIFITENGRAKVLDFGIAKRAVIPVAAPAEAEPETTVAAPPVKILPTGFAGTPAYMSPEQAAGQIMDSRSDLFSLGAVLYECLTGRRPFQGTDTRETIAAIRILDPDPPSAINPEVPKSLDRIVLKLLAKKPADRYQSSEQILSDLHALQQTQLLPTELTFKPTRLSRRVLALSILLVLGLAAGGAWWLRWSNRPYVPKSEALRWYETGLRALRDGTYRSAATALARAANLDDDFLLAHARLAEAWSELEYRDEASKSMLKATPPGFNMNRLSAREALTIEAIRYTVTGDYQKSVEKYQQIVDASPATDKAWVLFDLGRAQERLNDPTGALASYRRSIALDSQNTPAYLRIGQLLTSQKKYQEAEAALKQAGDLYRDASNVEGANEALQSTALLEIQRGNFEKSETLLQKALDLAKANGNQLQQINALRLLSQVKVS